MARIPDICQLIGIAPVMIELRKLLSSPLDIMVLSHRNPDGDAIGSSWALAIYLRNMGHTVRVAYPSSYPLGMDWVPRVAESLIHDDEPEVVNEHIKQADLIFLLDFNDLTRIDKMGETVAQAKAKRVLIDHHLYPDDCADWIYSDTTASSTCELVYDFIKEHGELEHFKPDIAEYIYMGIITDTGSFRYATTPKLFRSVAALLERGVRDVLLQNLIQNSMTEKQLRLIGHCLSERMEIISEYKTGIIWLSKKDYEQFDIQRGDTEGIVNYLLMVKDINMAVFVMEQPTVIKLSFRSKGEISVQEICRKHFKGGGHKNASGGHTFASLRQTLDKIRELLPENQEALLASY
jgi:bifunctional oligoribonuclease and PAP phosphatase NrnA